MSMSMEGQKTGFRIALSSALDLHSASTYTRDEQQQQQQHLTNEACEVRPLDQPTLSALFSRLSSHDNNNISQPEEEEEAAEAEQENGSEGLINVFNARTPSLAPPPAISSGNNIRLIPFPPLPPSSQQPQYPPPDNAPALPDLDYEPEPLAITRFQPSSSSIHQPLFTIAVTFSQPMIPLSSLTSHAAQAEDHLPISLSPPVLGRWRWIDTLTLHFEAEYHLPFSTQFTLTSTPHCKSSIGGLLPSPFSHTFSTAQPTVIHSLPHPSSTCASLSPLFFLGFDQCINPSTVLSHIQLTCSNHPSHYTSDYFRLIVDEADIEKEWPDFKRFYGGKPHKAGTRWVAFKLLKEELKTSTTYTLKVPAGCPSAEGPLKSIKDWSTSFTTYGPLVVQSSHQYQSWTPGQASWTIQFSNSLDHSTVSKHRVNVSPSVEQLQVRHDPSSSSIFLQAKFPPQHAGTSYTVTFDACIKDIYGQFLDLSKNSASFTADDHLPPAMSSLSGIDGMIIMDPALLDDPFFPLQVCNVSSVRIQVYQVGINDYSTEFPFFDRYKYAQGKMHIRGKRVSDSVVDIKLEKDVPQEHRIHLAPYLQFEQERLGQLLIIAEPTEKAWEEFRSNMSGQSGRSSAPSWVPFFAKSQNQTSYTSRDIVSAWIQCTKLSVDVFPDLAEQSVTAWVTCLSTGAPVNHASVTVLEEGINCRPWESFFDKELRQGNEVNIQGSTDGVEQEVQTNNEGLATVKVPSKRQSKVVAARLGNDITFISNVWMGDCTKNVYGWHVFSDRGIYKPEEEVHIKGYVRKLERDTGGGRTPAFAHGDITYSVFDARGIELIKGGTPLNDNGAFFLVFTIPNNANLGEATIYLKHTENCEHRVSIEVQEFRRPEFEITCSHHPVNHHYSHRTKGNFVIASVTAFYYAGGPLIGVETRWTVSAELASYVPPGLSGYEFGYHNSSWISMQKKEGRSLSCPSPQMVGVTGPDGTHNVRIEFGGLEEEPCTLSLTAKASVVDMNSQIQEAMTRFLVHPSEYFVGYKVWKTYGRQGEEVQGEVIVSDADGKLLSGIDVKLSISGEGKVQQEDAAGLLIYEDVKDEQALELRSEMQPVNFRFTPKLGGVYSLTFSVCDLEERYNQSVLDGFFVSAHSSSCANAGNAFPSGCQQDESTFIPKEQAQLIPDKDIYDAGGRAELLILSPFSPAEGLLTVTYDNKQVGDRVRFNMQTNSYSVSLTLHVSWIPKVDVQVHLVGCTSRDASHTLTALTDEIRSVRPAFATAMTKLNISSSTHRLTLSIRSKRPDELSAPGSTIHTTVTVMEQASNKAADGAEVSLIMVDESILSLRGYSLTDPLPAFYPEHPSFGPYYHHRQHCVLAEAYTNLALPVTFGHAMAASLRHKMFCCAAGASLVRPTGIAVRSNFNPLAAFIPGCQADEQGQVELIVKLPDNLTRYRVWAVAATETQFGMAESSLTVQLPLMIRPSPPRFLNFLDCASFTVVLQNQTEQSLPLQVGAKGRNAKIGDAACSGYSFILPAKGRFAVSFPLKTVNAGVAHLQFVASVVEGADLPPLSDASELAIPVYTPTTSECFAIYGDLGKQQIVLQPIEHPVNVFPQFGGLKLSISSTSLQSLADALLYLYEYPYGCNEQLASRIIGFASLWEVLKAFQVKEIPTEEQLISRLDGDLLALKSRQMSCGGWSWWTSGCGTHHEPYISLHVACALVKAAGKAFVVDKEMLTAALEYCAEIESHIDTHPWSHFWSKETKHALMAYALYIQTLHGKNVSHLASVLLNKAATEHLTMEACGWMLMALSFDRKERTEDIKVLMDHIMSNVIESADHANFMTSCQDDGISIMLHSNRRTDAILLEALLAVQPSSDLCSKLAKGLQAHRTAGRWKNTQENCFALSALNRFFAVYEKEDPHFTANVWLGKQLVSSHTCVGRSTESVQTSVPMSAILTKARGEEGNKETTLLIQKHGSGRMYYRLGLVYAPLDLHQEAAAYGFTVGRVYEGVDSFEHVRRDACSNFWTFKLGERVKVTVTVMTTVQHYHVALVDMIPAGCEPLNPVLRGAGAAPGGNDIGANNPYLCRRYSRLGWVEHENMRDERVEAFSRVLWPGKYEYSYVMRATCKGQFTVPPAKMEEMYNPEIFGRSGNEKVTIQ